MFYRPWVLRSSIACGEECVSCGAFLRTSPSRKSWRTSTLVWERQRRYPFDGCTLTRRAVSTRTVRSPRWWSRWRKPFSPVFESGAYSAASPFGAGLQLHARWSNASGASLGDIVRPLAVRRRSVYGAAPRATWRRRATSLADRIAVWLAMGLTWRRGPAASDVRISWSSGGKPESYFIHAPRLLPR